MMVLIAFSLSFSSYRKEKSGGRRETCGVVFLMSKSQQQNKGNETVVEVVGINCCPIVCLRENCFLFSFPFASLSSFVLVIGLLCLILRNDIFNK